MSAPNGLVQPESVAMRYCFDLCRRYARANRPVVFVGPVGSGKTVLAGYLHSLSRRSGRLVTIASGELSDSLYNDVLFGHVRGAFTGAIGERPGAFQRAANGSLLFDDLAYMPNVAQSAVLRALEDRRFTPLGASRDIPVTCREMYATTIPPERLVDDGRLLPDLESRLGEMIIPVPALSDRVDEIPGLAAFFADIFAAECGLLRPPPIAGDAVVALGRYDWPKNVRELRAVVERALLHAVDEGADAITLSHLPDRIARPARPRTVTRRKRVSRELVEHALTESGGNKSEAARRLGVHRNTVARTLGSDT